VSSGAALSRVTAAATRTAYRSSSAMIAKELIRSILISEPGRAASRAMLPGTVTIFMLHRFHDGPPNAEAGHSGDELRALLRTLRQAKMPVIALDTLARNGAPATGGVVFTVDDGFADFASIAWPIFREFDCPVTVFLTTGFLDRQLWPWWERVLWAFERTKRIRAEVSHAGRRFVWDLTNLAEKRRGAAQLTEALKRLPNAEREGVIDALPQALDVEIPVIAPAEHAAMTWDDVRRSGREGATFGPHTVSHPILSRVDDARAESEIADSWKRVVAETAAAVPVFCYPNGDPDSFGQREEAIVARHGFRLALSTIAESATRADFVADASRRFRIPRHGCPTDPRTFLWLASGWGRLGSRFAR
jgi:peptidoglycan/xylan/chitin deacetylase (PgdA/CDA1 family)